MDTKLIRLVEEKYGLEINDYRPLRKAWVLTTDQGIKFLKSFCFHDGPRLQFIDGAMHHLMENGFDHIIPFDVTLDKIPYITYGSQVYFMTPFIKNIRQSNYDNPTELGQAAQLLAQLHLASAGYHPPAKLNPQFFWGKWPKRMKEKIQHLYTFRAALEKKDKLDQFDKLFIEKFPYYFQQAHLALEKMMDSDYHILMLQEKQLASFCHHDYEYHNILITPDDKYYIIDFDYLLCDTHLHDLASLLIRVGRRSKWNPAKQQDVLPTYHSIYPLKPAEISVLKAMLLFPQAYWQVGFARYFEEQPWPLKRFVRTIKHKTSYEQKRLNYIDNIDFPG